jgi:NADPH-dependent glutamate synthase beta subunit-like oxidoreductase
MEVARACGERGHSVYLFERKGELGGQVRLAAELPGRSNLISIVKWYEGQLSNLEIDIRMRSEIGTDPQAIEGLLSQIHPDCVVLATGSTPIKDGTQSFNYQKIRGFEFAMTLDDALSGNVQIGRNVVIIDELAFVECLALAEKLGKSGSKVELVTRDLAPGMELQWSLQIPYVYERALKAGIVLTPISFVEEISRNSVLLYNIHTGEKTLRENINTTILHTGRVPSDELVQAFSRSGLRVETAGECNLAGRQMGDAITEAYDLALTI